jgi:hypothetical protein
LYIGGLPINFERDPGNRHLRVANLMLKRYRDEAGVESIRRADELAEQGDHNGAAVSKHDTFRTGALTGALSLKLMAGTA